MEWLIKTISRPYFQHQTRTPRGCSDRRSSQRAAASKPRRWACSGGPTWALLLRSALRTPRYPPSKRRRSQLKRRPSTSAHLKLLSLLDNNHSNSSSRNRRECTASARPAGPRRRCSSAWAARPTPTCAACAAPCAAAPSDEAHASTRPRPPTGSFSHRYRREAFVIYLERPTVTCDRRLSRHFRISYLPTKLKLSCNYSVYRTLHEGCRTLINSIQQ